MFFKYEIKQDFIFMHSASKTAPCVNLHFHDSYEIFWFIDGNIRYSVEGNVYDIKQDDILITNKRELHAPIFIDKGRYERCLMQIKPQFLSEFVTEDYNLFSAFENRRLGIGNHIPSSAASASGLHSLMRKIKHCCKEGKPESTALIKAHTVELLVKLSKITGNKEEYIGNQKVSAIIKYINENLGDDLSLAALEKKFFISKYYLAHLFKEQTGFSLANYITQKRIIRAKELILQNIPIIEAAEAVGFDDYSAFYRSFKRMTGKSPREFSSFVK